VSIDRAPNSRIKRMNYREAIAHLNSFINFERLPEPRFNTQIRDLDRFRELLDELGNPQSRYPIIHIAGTKGKGSTAAMISSILRAAGYRTGLYTSPHLVTVRERIRVDGRIIPKAEFASLIDYIGKTSTSSYPSNHPTYRTVFEYLTAAALLWFARKRVDFAVVEAGLGGKLDATVVVDPLLTVMTPIGLDHTTVLGGSVSAIAADKAHIIKSDVPAVSARQSAEARSQLVRRAGEVGTELTFAPGHTEFEPLSSGLHHQSFFAPRRSLGNDAIHLNLAGRFQLDNTSTVLTSIGKLVEAGFPVAPRAVQRGLSRVRLQGRMQLVRRKPSLVLDGSHNPMSIEALLESLSELIGNRSLHVIFSAMRSKPAGRMLELLSSVAANFYIAPISFPKGMTNGELRSEAEHLHLPHVICTDIPSAFDRACLEAGSNGLILATGSLYLAGEVIRHLRGLPPPYLDGRIDDRI